MGSLYTLFNQTAVHNSAARRRFPTVPVGKRNFGYQCVTLPVLAMIFPQTNCLYQYSSNTMIISQEKMENGVELPCRPFLINMGRKDNDECMGCANQSEGEHRHYSVPPLIGPPLENGKVYLS